MGIFDGHKRESVFVEKGNRGAAGTTERFKPLEVIELYTELIKSIVDYPDQVMVTHYQGEHTHVFEADVDKRDLGKIIGKHGLMAQALRKILLSIASKHKVRAVFEIRDN